jgi:hypothetical protein
MNKQAFGNNTEAMIAIAEMACNLDPETVYMRNFHSCGNKHCILGHAEIRGIIHYADDLCLEDFYKWFGMTVTLTPQQIGYAILNELGIEHI